MRIDTVGLKHYALSPMIRGGLDIFIVDFKFRSCLCSPVTREFEDGMQSSEKNRGKIGRKR